MQRCLLPGIVAAALLAVAAHQARPMTGGGVRVHLVCAVAAPAPEALCAAMQEALATALPDARIRTAAPVEADPEAWTLRFTARQPGPHPLVSAHRRDLRMARTGHQMIVHQPAGLHPGIDDGRPAKPEPGAFSALDRAGSGRLGGNLGQSRQTGSGPACPSTPPRPRRANPSPPRSPERRGHCRWWPRSCRDGARSRDPTAAASHIRLAPAGDRRRIEARKGSAERIALAQDGDPGKPGLKPVEHELFPQRAAVPLRHAPFGVVIGNIKRIGPAPAASFHLGPHRQFTAVKAACAHDRKWESGGSAMKPLLRQVRALRELSEGA
jgi:hypothetical protein